MNEEEMLKNLPEDKLIFLKMAIEEYLQDVIDTGKLVEEIFSKTRELYDAKLREIELIISNRKDTKVSDE